MRPTVGAAVAGALALLLLAAPAPGASTRNGDGSYVAHGPGGLRLALVVHAGRLQAYACDGRARRAYFAARAGRGPLSLYNRAGDRLALRLHARTAHATLTVTGHPPIELVARRARAAIFTVTIRPDGAVFGIAPNGGVLAGHLSGAGLVGAAGFAGVAPGTFSDPDFARGQLFVDGRHVPFAPDAAAQALRGTWRWIVTPSFVAGATARSFDIEQTLGVTIPRGTKFLVQSIGDQSTGSGAGR